MRTRGFLVWIFIELLYHGSRIVIIIVFFLLASYTSSRLSVHVTSSPVLRSCSRVVAGRLAFSW